MADTDPALYVLRYNQTSQEIEGQGGTPAWNPLTLRNPDPVAGITQLTGDVTAGPGSGSTVATVAFVGGVSAANVATGITTANNALPKAGGTMTGDLTISESAVGKVHFISATHTGDVLLSESAGLQLRYDSNPFLLFNGAEVRTTAYAFNYTGVPLYGTGDASTIGAGSSTPASAILSATSTTLGFLPPRMTTTQRDAIATPAAGLMIYNTTTAKLNVFTTAWEAITSA